FQRRPRGLPLAAAASKNFSSNRSRCKWNNSRARSIWTSWPHARSGFHTSSTTTRPSNNAPATSHISMPHLTRIGPLGRPFRIAPRGKLLLLLYGPPTLASNRAGEFPGLWSTLSLDKAARDGSMAATDAAGRRWKDGFLGVRYDGDKRQEQPGRP